MCEFNKGYETNCKILGFNDSTIYISIQSQFVKRPCQLIMEAGHDLVATDQTPSCRIITKLGQGARRQPQIYLSLWTVAVCVMKAWVHTVKIYPCHVHETDCTLGKLLGEASLCNHSKNSYLSHAGWRPLLISENSHIIETQNVLPLHITT